MPDVTRSQPPKLLDNVRRVPRLHHHSMHTERSSVERVVRFVRFPGMRPREDLFPAEPKVDAFLTDSAVHAQVAAATQHQAMNALVFLYKRPNVRPLTYDGYETVVRGPSSPPCPWASSLSSAAP